MQLFEIWSEGYAVSGAHGTATLFGTQEAETFKEAIELFFKGRDDRHYVNSSLTTYWGCELFDNELYARKTFG